MRIVEEALTFDDVLLLPALSRVLPRDVRLDTQLTRDIRLHMPIISAAMDTVTEARLAITLAQEGGIGIIHKNMNPEAQAGQVQRVKKFESGVIKEPITVPPSTSIRDVMDLTRAHNISGVPVVDGEKLVGIVTSRDLRFETHFDNPVSSIMTPKERLVTVREGAERDEILALLHRHRIEKVLVVNDNFQLRGLVTVKDIQKSKDYPNACKDEQGRLRVGAAVGTGEGTEDRVAALVAAGVDVIVVDTAHGHSQGVLDRVRWVKDHYPDVQVIGGHIATAPADNGHHIKIFLPVSNFTKLSAYGTHGPFALQQCREKLDGKPVFPAVIADNIYKIAETFACFHRNHGNSFRKQRERALFIFIKNTFFFQPFDGKLLFARHLTQGKTGFYINDIQCHAIFFMITGPGQKQNFQAIF